MKRNLLFLAALATLFTACEDRNVPQSDPEGTTYPRVQLIEHFTGADCGYCPMGMDYIYDVYSQNPDNYVWVSNHYGYGTDEYTITGSSTIGKALLVSGAPNISLNRTKYMLDGTSSRSYHPAYLEEICNKPATTATEMIEITREYDAASSLLHVTINGKTSNPELLNVRLTVGVTESGMTGVQADYQNTWEGWKSFTHTHAIRVYASAALGDSVHFEKGHFTAEYDITIKSKWKAENCEIVAWITAENTKYPVLNAAKLPVVEGSKGGEDIKHAGIEEVAVPATYPESGAPATDDFNLTTAFAKYYTYTDYTFLNVVAYDLTTSLGTIPNYPTYKLYPYLSFYILQEPGKTSLEPGVYSIVNASDAAMGTIIAGERNDEEHTLDYSMFYYVYPSGTSLGGYKQWLLRSGTVTINVDGTFSIDATTLNGSSVKAHYAGAAIVPSKASAPQRAKTVKQIDAPASRLILDEVAY